MTDIASLVKKEIQMFFCLNSNIVKHNVFIAIKNGEFGLRVSEDFTQEEIDALVNSHDEKTCGFCKVFNEL